MALLSLQTTDYNGKVITYASADVAGDTFANDGMTYLEVKNGGGAPITVTVNSIDPCNQGHDHNVAITVANGTSKVIGFFSKKRFNSAGIVAISYSAVTSVTVAVVNIAK